MCKQTDKKIKYLISLKSVSHLAQGHAAKQLQIWGSNLTSLTPELSFKPF